MEAGIAGNSYKTYSCLIIYNYCLIQLREHLFNQNDVM